MALVLRSLALFASSPFGSSGATVNFYSYSTPDAVATLLTAGYFNDARAKLKVGDVIFAVAGAGTGTPEFLVLKLDAVPSAGNVLASPDGDTHGGGTRAVVPTADGLTTGLILSGDSMVVATSANADHILTLPLASAATRGRRLSIFVVAGTNCELRTPATSNQTINNVDADGSAEALLTHSQFYDLVQHLDTGWLLMARTALGAVATAIVPDA